MRRLVFATVAALAFGAYATPTPAAQGGVRGGPDGQGTPAEVAGNGRAGVAASHDNAHGTSEEAAARAGRNYGGEKNGVGNEDSSPGDSGGNVGSER